MTHDTALVAPRLRTATWCIAAGLGALVAIGGIAVHGDRSALDVEVRVQDVIDARFGNTGFWGDGFGIVIPRAGLVVLLALVTWTLTQRWWRAVVACAAAPLAVAITEHGLKPLVDRKDPGNPELFYPSGHLTGVGALATLVVVIVAFRLGPVWARCSVVGLCVGASGVALLTTVAGHGHGPLDALAGLPTGVAIALAWMLLVDLAFDRLHRHTAAAARGGAAPTGADR